MFEDLIKKLKSQADELRKKLSGGGSDDEYEDEDEESELDEESDDDDGKTVKVQITDLLQESTLPDISESKKKNLKNDEEEEGEEEDQNAKKEKKKKITYAVVGVLIITLLGWDYIFPPVPEAPAPIKRVKKKRKKREPKKQLKKETKKQETIKEETKAEVKVSPVIETKPELKIETKPELKVKKEEKVVDVPPGTALGLPSKKEIVIEPTPIKKLGEADEIVSTVKKKSKPSLINMVSKIEKEVEYVAPPSYERSGRGLVYNCSKKHWACVDKFSYLTCRENASWSKENEKSPECMTKNVYSSVEDCHTIQRHFIESSEATTFCTESMEVPNATDDDISDSEPSLDKDELNLLE